MDSTQQALNSFASAMGEYAQHLASHTTAVKELASVSQELRSAVREQNRFFSQRWGGPTLKETTVEAIPEKEITARSVKPIPGCYKRRVLAPSDE